MCSCIGHVYWGICAVVVSWGEKMNELELNHLLGNSPLCAHGAMVKGDLLRTQRGCARSLCNNATPWKVLNRFSLSYSCVCPADSYKYTHFLTAQYIIYNSLILRSRASKQISSKQVYNIYRNNL